MASINTTSINAAVRSALRSVHSYADAIEALKTALRGIDRAKAQSIVTPAIASFYGINAVDGQRGVTFEGSKGDAQFETATRARSRLLAAVYGGASSAHKEPAVKRFDQQRIAMIQNALADLTKAQARAYLAKAFEKAFE